MSIGESGIQRNSQLDLVSAQDALRLSWVKHQNLGVTRAWGGVPYDGHYPGEQWERGGTVTGFQIEHETGLIKKFVVRRTIVNASNKGDGSKEWELGACICVRPSLYRIAFGCFGVVHAIDAGEPCVPHSINVDVPTSRNVTVNGLCLTGEYRSAWNDPRTGISLPASCFHAFVGRQVKVSDQQVCGDGHILCRRMTDVTDNHLGPERNTIRIIGTKAGRLDFFQFDPWPLSQIHLIQLAQHDIQLVGRGLVSTRASGAHLVQLSPVDDELRDTDKDRRDRQGRDDPRSSGRAPSRPVGGGLLFLLGAALLKVAFDSTDAPYNPVWLLRLAWGVGLLAVVAIGQGTVLILTGQWLL